MKTIFNKKKRIQENQILKKKVCRTIRNFFEYADLKASIISFGITDVSVEQNKKEMKITITLERPGLLIGKHGRVINALETHLKGVFSMDVSISIKESKLWV